MTPLFHLVAHLIVWAQIVLSFACACAAASHGLRMHHRREHSIRPLVVFATLAVVSGCSAWSACVYLLAPFGDMVWGPA